MSGIFRQFCNVLADEAFDLVKALGEAAVEQAQKPAEKPSRGARLNMTSLDVLAPMLHELTERMGRRFRWVQRNESEQEIIVGQRLPCGHAHRIHIDERDLFLIATEGRSGAAALVDFVIDRFMDDADYRSCTCVPHYPTCAACHRYLSSDYTVTPLWSKWDCSSEFAAPLTPESHKTECIRTCKRPECTVFARRKQEESRQERWSP